MSSDRPVLLVFCDSLSYYGPTGGLPSDDPRIWPNIVASQLGWDLELIGRLMMRTTARNQLHGRVCGIEEQGLNDLITIELPGGAHIRARVTRESTEKLELGDGRPVIALMKAGWLYVDLPQIECPAGLNALEGRVEDIREAGDGPSEVRIQLPGGQMLCALVDQERIDILRLAAGSRVRTQFSPAQVILGTPV